MQPWWVLPSALQEVGFICSCEAQLLCGVVCLDERDIVQGRKLKGATAGEAVSGAPADSVVRVLWPVTMLCCSQTGAADIGAFILI